MMKTPISYYGGKQTLLKHILPLIPPHTLYTEAFCGGCAVYFAKEPVACEVINDTNSEMVNFYRVAKMRFAELSQVIDGTLHSRSEHGFAHFIYLHPEYFDSLTRAWAVWVCSKMSFASMIDSTFGYDRVGTTAKKVDNARINFTDDICKRLSRTTIECEDGLSVIRRYDTPDAFHFVDPPYVGSDCGHYAGAFNEQNLQELLVLLSTVKGKFMLTMFPNEHIVDFAQRFDWKIYKVERTITASKTNRRRQEEWIIMNY